MEVSSVYRNFVVIPPVASAPASATADSVETLLPQGSQSVAPVAASSGANATDNGTNAGTPGSSADIPGQTTTVAKFTRDAATNSLVFMEINPQTQAVIVQFPDEQLLKLKSYLAEMQRHEEVLKSVSPGSNVTKMT